MVETLELLSLLLPIEVNSVSVRVDAFPSLYSGVNLLESARSRLLFITMITAVANTMRMPVTTIPITMAFMDAAGAVGGPAAVAVVVVDRLETVGVSACGPLTVSCAVLEILSVVLEGVVGRVVAAMKREMAEE